MHTKPGREYSNEPMAARCSWTRSTVCPWPLKRACFESFRRVSTNASAGVTRVTRDVRIIAASNRNVGRLVAEGSFRQDLYYRINVVPIHIPPLRERPDDVSALVGHFLDRLAGKYGGPRKVLGERAWAAALNYAWPGNLRELENVLERAYLFAPGSVIAELPVEVPAPDRQSCATSGTRRSTPPGKWRRG